MAMTIGRYWLIIIRDASLQAELLLVGTEAVAYAVLLLPWILRNAFPFGVAVEVREEAVRLRRFARGLPPGKSASVLRPTMTAEPSVRLRKWRLSALRTTGCVPPSPMPQSEYTATIASIISPLSSQCYGYFFVKRRKLVIFHAETVARELVEIINARIDDEFRRRLR